MMPYSEACERNKHPIFEVLSDYLANCTKLLEIGSGTGQHAVFFAERFPHLAWQPTDREEACTGIVARFREAGLNNLRPPLVLDVNDEHWPAGPWDCVFSANTAHIMDWTSVCSMFRGVSRVMPDDGIFCLYGPFNYHGRYTSVSNARFDDWLKLGDPESGIRNFENVDKLALSECLLLVADHAMPANNRMLVWRKAVRK